MPTKPTAATLKLATKIAEELFLDGSGEKADRLQLINLHGFYLGSWSLECAVGHIAAILKASKPKPKKRKAVKPDMLEACKVAMEACRDNLKMYQYKNEPALLEAFNKCRAAVMAAGKQPRK